jgi:sec-independent protein translocase protein TatC
VRPGGGSKRKAQRPPDGRMALVEHIRELRNRLGISLAALGVCVLVALLFREEVFELIKRPYCQTEVAERASVVAGQCELYAFGPFEQFAVSLRISFIAGVVVSAPVWLYQLGAFITPGLHRHEKKYAAAFLGAALVLFVTGTVFAYFTISRGLQFLLTFGGEGIVTLPSIQSYLSFVTLTLLGFGIAFLFPVVVLFLNFVGLFPTSRMRAWRRGMIVGIAVGAAVLTPSQDPFTFMAMALPLYALYEGCIVIGRLRERAARRRRAVEPGAQELERLGDDETSYVDDRPSPLSSDAAGAGDVRDRPREQGRSLGG